MGVVDWGVDGDWNNLIILWSDFVLKLFYGISRADK
jgi:hypothetical protein